MGNSDAENRAKKIIEWMRDKPLSLKMLEPAFELAIAAAALDAENRWKEAGKQLAEACRKMRRTMYSDRSEESILADAALAAWNNLTGQT